MEYRQGVQTISFLFYATALQGRLSSQETHVLFFKFCVNLLKKISVDHSQIYLGSISISAERKITCFLDLPVRANICAYSEEKNNRLHILCDKLSPRKG